MEQRCYKCGALVIGKKCNSCGVKNKRIKEDLDAPRDVNEVLASEEEVDQQVELPSNGAKSVKMGKILPIVGIAAVLIIVGSVKSKKMKEQSLTSEEIDGSPANEEKVNEQAGMHIIEEQIDQQGEVPTSEEQANHQDEMLTNEEQDSQKAELPANEERVNQRDRSPIKWGKIFSIFGIVVASIFAVVILLYQLNPTGSSAYRYVCYDAPTLTTPVPDVTTVTTIESYGSRIVRWIEQDTFPRQAYIDYHWGLGWGLSDDDIRDWFEGPSNIMEMEGTYWELVSIDDYYIITNFIFDYENMSSADLDLLWESNFSNVTRYSAIRGLEEQGAVCVRQ